MRIKAQRRKALGFCIAECVPVGEKGPASGGGVRGGGSPPRVGSNAPRQSRGERSEDFPGSAGEVTAF